MSFKLSGTSNLAVSKNDELVSKYLEARESHFKILILQFTQMVGFKVVVTASLLLIGGALVLSQEMNIGQFVAAEIIILLVIASVEKLIVGLEGTPVPQTSGAQKNPKMNLTLIFSMNFVVGMPSHMCHI